MLFLAYETIACALENVHFELHLGVFSLTILHFVPEKIERVLDRLRSDIVLFQLSTFDSELSPRRV